MERMFFNHQVLMDNIISNRSNDEFINEYNKLAGHIGISALAEKENFHDIDFDGKKLWRSAGLTALTNGIEYVII